MDYALVHALQHKMAGIPWVLTFYDINCQYMKNLQQRMAGSQYLVLSPQPTLVPSIGIWHIHGHQLECFAQYAPSFIMGAGHVDGEIIETLWSTINIISRSACRMSSPHRQEFLDFQMNDSNFLKMIKMCKLFICLQT